MPKRNRLRKTMKGGFLDELSNNISSMSDSLVSGVSNIWDKTKNAASSLTGSTSSSSSYVPQTTSTNNLMSTSTYGGRTKRRRMRGGYSPNSSTTGLATTAAPFSGQTAKPHTWVGGKTKRRRGSRKSRRHRKHRQ